MNVTIDLWQLLNLLVHVAVLIPLILYLRKQHKRVFGLEAFRTGLVAHAKLHPRVTDAETHKTWLARYNELKDSESDRDLNKAKAYLNRLIEVGILDAEGNLIDNGD